MSKITSSADLHTIKSSVKAQMSLRGQSETPDSMIQIRVAMATCGIASGARIVMDYMISELDKRNIPAIVTQTGCMGYCYAEPTIEVTRPGHDPLVFGYVDSKKADQIIEKYIKNGELLDGIIPVNYENIEGK